MNTTTSTIQALIIIVSFQVTNLSLARRRMSMCIKTWRQKTDPLFHEILTKKHLKCTQTWTSKNYASNLQERKQEIKIEGHY